MRRLTTFDCEGSLLVGSIDASTDAARSGLLIVSGGNEVRAGAHRGMALLATRIAAAGHAVMRFDRRGVGDAEGTNRGFRSSGPDLRSAVDVFRRETGVERVVAFGNCDAATALALFHSGLAIDGLVLANPWVVVPDEDLPPPAAIRARYGQRLRDPRAWLRLMRGRIDLARLRRGLAAIAQRTQAGDLAIEVADALAGSPLPLTILLADRDNTAVAFRAEWAGRAFAAVRKRTTVVTRDTASHSFAAPGDAQWLEAQLLAVLRA